MSANNVLASNAPEFGFTGVYKGTVMHEEKNYSATLSLVDYKGVLRGVLNIAIVYQDEDGRTWEGASVLLKGEKAANNLFVTDFQCSAVAKICDQFGSLSKDFKSNFRISLFEEGVDYQLFKISFSNTEKLNTSNDRVLPFTSGILKMEQTITNIPSVQNSWIGNWAGEGYFPENYFVATPLPFFSLLDATFYNDINGKLSLKWFVYYKPQGGWSSLDDIYIETQEEDKLIVRYGYHRYILNRSGDYVLGFVTSDYIDPKDYFDFWALFFLFR